jgi:hypothetical protein
VNQNHDLPGTMLALALAAIGLFLLVLLLPAPAGAACLTQAEARARWPTSHLYWHTRQRCWDNQRASHGPAQPKGVTPSTDRSEDYKKPPRQRWAAGVKTVRWQDYNELDAAADRDQFFRGDSVAMWPPFFDTWNYLWNRLWRPDDGRQ